MPTSNVPFLEYLRDYDFVVITDGSCVTAKPANDTDTRGAYAAGYKASVLSSSFNHVAEIVGGANHCAIGKAELRAFIIAAEYIVDLIERRDITVEPENLPLKILWLCDRDALVKVANRENIPSYNTTMWEYFFEIFSSDALFDIKAKKATRDEIAKLGNNDVDAHFIAQNMKDIHEYLETNEKDS